MAQLTTVIPVYNGEKYLELTLESVARQTRRPDRVIVNDNCSTDRTPEIVSSFRGLKIEWRQNERNIGLLGNANHCLSFATETDYLHLLMADDLVTERFYEKLTGSLEPVRGRALGYAYNDVIDADGNRTTTDMLPAGAARIVPRNQYLARQSTLNTVLLPAVLFKTDRQPSPCLLRDLPQTSDCLFLAEWALYCEQLIEIPEYLCHYRLHPSSATTQQNLYNLQATVVDEWRAISTILGWMKEPAFAHWVRTHKSKCLFAARSYVKSDMLRKSHPDFARDVVLKMRQIVSPLHALLGKMAVVLRDAIDRARGRELKSAALARLVGLASDSGK